MADPTPTPEPNESAAETEIEAPQSRRRGILVAADRRGGAHRASVSGGTPPYSEDTDDAQVNGHLIQVSSRIAGHVVKVDVEENQLVKAGDPIVELDPSDYQVAVENAEAALASAKANAAAASVNVPIITINTGSNLRSADADVTGAQRHRGAGRGATGGGQSARGAGPGQQRQGAVGSRALQAAGGKGRDQQAAV